jgi:hypothetical protein
MEKHPYYFKRDAVEVSMAVEIEEVVSEEVNANNSETTKEEPTIYLVPENYY